MSVKIVKEESQGNENSQPHAEASFRKVLLTRCQQMFEKKRKEETGEDGKKSDDERIAELQQSLTIEDNKVIYIHHFICLIVSVLSLYS